MPSKNGNSLQNIIASQAEREVKQFTKGYHFIYRIVEQQIKTQMSRNPLLLRASITIPQYARGNIVIPMTQGKAYVCKQLHTRGIHVVQDDGIDGLVVSWASLTTPLQASTKTTTPRTSLQNRHNVTTIEISSSSSTSSSSASSSPDPEAAKHRNGIQAKGKMKNNKKTSKTKDGVITLPPEVERQLEELHTLVLRAASGC